MRRVIAQLGILLLTALVVWNGRCLSSCAAEPKLSPCHKQPAHQPPQLAACVLQMVAERPAAAPELVPAVAPAPPAVVVADFAAAATLPPASPPDTGPHRLSLRI